MRQDPNRTGEMAVFVRVVDLGGFASAGRALNLTQSAVSKLVSRLETRLGVTLLRRSTRTLSLTPEGDRFYRRAVAILAEIDAAEREAASGGVAAGRVRINTSASYALHILMPLLPDFFAQYPDISLDIVQSDTIADLISEGSDIAIRASELPSSDLIARSLGTSELIVVVAPAWLARNGAIESVQQLLRLDRVGYTYSRSVGGWMADPNAVPERARISDGEGVRRLALSGIGPARLAAFTVREDLEAGRLVQVLPGLLPAPVEPFHAVYVGQATQLPARVRVLIDWLAERGRVD